MAHDDLIIGHSAVSRDIGGIWLSEMDGERVRVGIIVTPEAMLAQSFERRNQGKIGIDIECRRHLLAVVLPCAVDGCLTQLRQPEQG